MRARSLAALALLAAACRRAPSSPTRCPAPVLAWVRACTAAEGVSVTPRFCPAGGVILTAQAQGGDPLQVEITRDAHRGFVRVGPLGLSPVGNFPDWESAPATTRGAFDAVVRCARRDAALPVATGALVPHPERPH